MKLTIQILAWLGLLIIVILLPGPYTESYVMASGGSVGAGVGYFVIMLAGILGVLLGLAGLTRIGYYWMFLIGVGIVYIGSFYGCFFEFSKWFFVYIIPGILLIAEGIFYRIRELRQKNKQM